VKAEDESHYAVVESQLRFDRSSFERFDRIAFAMRALRILQPPGMRVAVYSRGHDFQLERGRDLAFGEAASFALLGIPRDASRESIALAVTELAGLGNTPLLVPLLVSAGSVTES
jgi:hypothetical protein